MESLNQTLVSLARASESRLEFWSQFASQIRAEKVLEIGVWKGEFAAHLLVRCQSIKEYAMIDPWRKLPDWNKPFNVDDTAFDDVYRQALAKTEFAREKRRVLRGTTLEVIDCVPDLSLDLAYVDGDHTLRGAVLDLISVYPKVRSGGFVGGDDFGPSIWQHGARFEPTLVNPFAAYFAEAVGARFFALPFGQFLIAKTSGPRGYSFTDITGKYSQLTLRDQMRIGRRIGAYLKRIF